MFSVSLDGKRPLFTFRSQETTPVFFQEPQICARFLSRARKQPVLFLKPRSNPCFLSQAKKQPMFSFSSQEPTHVFFLEPRTNPFQEPRSGPYFLPEAGKQHLFSFRSQEAAPIFCQNPGSGAGASDPVSTMTIFDDHNHRITCPR